MNSLSIAVLLVVAIAPCSGKLHSNNMSLSTISSSSERQEVESPTYRRANNFLKAGKYEAAANLYDRIFSEPADGPDFEGVNPLVYDAHLDGPFGSALALAKRGDFCAAAAQMESIKASLPPFSSAGFLAGAFNWACGRRSSAMSDWRRTLLGPSFAMSDEDVDPDKQAAADMLEWAKFKAVRAPSTRGVSKPCACP